jgi:hypothetical protein
MASGQGMMDGKREHQGSQGEKNFLGWRTEEEKKIPPRMARKKEKKCFLRGYRVLPPTLFDSSSGVLP